MTTPQNKPGFVCPVCARRLYPPYLPGMPPYCPSCGADMKPNEAALNSGLVVFCAKSHHAEPLYKYPKCPHCGALWSGFVSKSDPEQRPESAFEVLGVREHRRRGKEGG